MSSKIYDTLVLSGSSIKGFAFLGALQYLYENKQLNIQNYVGTSAGAMICYLLIIGYTPLEIFLDICTNQVLEKMQHFNIVAILQGKGAISFNIIRDHLERMTINKIGYLPTMQDLKTKFNTNFVCVTYNLTENKPEYITENTHPTLPCITALHMSGNLPLVFEHFKYGHSFYIDGGICNHFPINYAEKLGKNIIGLVIDGKHTKVNPELEIDVLEYIYNLMWVPIIQSMEDQISKIDFERTTIVRIDGSDRKCFDFDIKPNIKMDLFSSGWSQIENHFTSSFSSS